MSRVDENYLFGAPMKEEDEPLDPSQLDRVDPITAMKVRIDNNDKKRKDKRYYTAFKLIIGCLVMLGIIYLVDMTAMIALKGEVSTMTKDIVEIVKTLLFTLSGYLFAKREGSE